MYLYLSFAIRQDKISIEKREPMDHKVSLKEVTFCKIHINQDVITAAAKCIQNNCYNLLIVQDKEHFIELEFDNGKLNQVKDFRPHLPLLFRW